MKVDSIMSKKVEIRVSLEEEFIEKIERLKSYYGIKNRTELIRVIIQRSIEIFSIRINPNIFVFKDY